MSNNLTDALSRLLLSPASGEFANIWNGAVSRCIRITEPLQSRITEQEEEIQLIRKLNSDQKALSGNIIRSLEEENAKLKAVAQCPYISTGQDGTSHCRLAEGSARLKVGGDDMAILTALDAACIHIEPENDDGFASGCRMLTPHDALKSMRPYLHPQQQPAALPVVSGKDIVQNFREYAFEIPLGKENKHRGASEYNWAIYHLKMLEAALAALQSNDGGGNE
ncbi:hypothetical protein [Limnoglobus roseus]|uniref:Ead/Ea22-like family protein n=1 Tax=Limnoglobus roseus TaxID=2598579 RepID=A0A5C1AEU0_9BACT|nr:hypothetical protein [Limnoglobus roseus]QEL16767.1 hypothetical protein PX52LOC_03736 [Limnoglobus roseus]